MANERLYASKRLNIAEALAEKLKIINGTGDFKSDLENRTSVRLKFLDEITEFPSTFVVPANEFREYQGGGYKDRFLMINIFVYVHEEFAMKVIDELIEDIETVIETYSNLTYYDKDGAEQRVHQLSIVSIETDQGLLEPYGNATISIMAHY